MATAILATIGILVLGLVAKLLTRDWFHPATIFACFWAFACGVPIIIAPENITSGSGPLWILLNAIFVIAGAIAGTAFACTSRSRRSAAGRAETHRSAISRKWLRTVTAVCILVALLHIVAYLRVEGLSIASLTSLRNLSRTAMKMSVERYFGSGSVPRYVELLLIAVYLGPLFGGALYLHRQKRSDTALALLSLLPSLVCFATESTRASILFGATMWAAGYLSVRPYAGIRAAELKKKSLLLMVAAIPLMMLLIAVGDSLRSGHANATTGMEALLSNRVKTYVSGHVAALSQWLDTTDFSEMTHSPGQYTVAGIYNLIRPGARVIGVFSQRVNITTGQTNVFTYFRELIQDATLPGSLIVMLVLAFIGGFAYRKVFERKVAWIGILAAFYAGALFGLSSIFDYTSMILAFVLYWVAWAKPWHKRERPKWVQQVS